MPWPERIFNLLPQRESHENNKLAQANLSERERLADDHEPAVPTPAILGPVPEQEHAVLVADDVRPVEVTVALRRRPS